MSSMDSSLPWVEKYRPRTLHDIVGHQDALFRVQDLLQRGTLTHILFSGPAGTGKTSTAQCVARAWLQRCFHNAGGRCFHSAGERCFHEASTSRGVTTALTSDDTWTKGLLELNASDERSRNTVMDRVAQFCRITLRIPKRVVILDEVDSMVPEAQRAVRVLMDKHGHKTAFLLACNAPEKLVPELEEKCAILRFGAMPHEAMHELIAKVVIAEGLTELSPGSLDALVAHAGGDARAALNLMQGCLQTCGALTEDTLAQMSGLPPLREVQEIVAAHTSGQFIKARALLNQLLQQGFAEVEVLEMLSRVITEGCLTLPETTSLRWLSEISQAWLRAEQGYLGALQMTAVLARV